MNLVKPFKKTYKKEKQANHKKEISLDIEPFFMFSECHSGHQVIPDRQRPGDRGHRWPTGQRQQSSLAENRR